MHKLIPLLLIAVLCPNASAQQQPTATAEKKFALTEAQQAYQRGEYQTAKRAFLLLAEKGDPKAQVSLGRMYQFGKGVTPDLAQAAAWYRKAAEQGDAAAQYLFGGMCASYFKNPLETAMWYRRSAEQGYVDAQQHLALMYEVGEVIPQNYPEAVRWYQKAAEQGMAPAAMRLGSLYLAGAGVPQDYVRAHMWFNIAGTLRYGESSEARDARDVVARVMTPQQLARAQEMATQWESSLGATSESQQFTTIGPDLSPKLSSSGTGFVISREGDVLTNQHVVDGCRSVVVTGGSPETNVAVVAGDAANDLSLLRLKSPRASVLNFSESERPRLGQEVIVIGYPLQGILTSSVSLTTGVLSALAGPGGDTRLLQITAPVQPGNSGGPLLDSSGNVVGVVSSTVDALGVAAATGTIPQNINFAIRASTIRTFLDLHGVKYLTAPSAARRETSSIADQATKAVISIECWK
jgi:FOG: TPR repeat, SEL1 subfamily